MKSITVKEIHVKLHRHYTRNTHPPERDLHIHKSYDSYSCIGSVYFSLDGSPPKGYAVFIPELWVVNLYDFSGRRFRNITNCKVVDLDNFKDDDILSWAGFV